MADFFRSRVRSLGYAFSGWWHVIRTQRNAWIHAVVSLLVIAVAFWLGLPTGDWALIILAIAMVWTAEFVNTALEAVVDLASNHEQPRPGQGQQRCRRSGGIDRRPGLNPDRPAGAWPTPVG